MPEFEIPEAAVEAALSVYVNIDPPYEGGGDRAEVVSIAAAAAPHIVAAAYRQAADEYLDHVRAVIHSHRPDLTDVRDIEAAADTYPVTAMTVSAWLRRRADAICPPVPVDPRGGEVGNEEWPALSMVRQVVWPNGWRVRAVVAHGRAAGMRVEHSRAFRRHYIYATGEPFVFEQFRAELERIFSTEVDVVLGTPETPDGQ